MDDSVILTSDFLTSDSFLARLFEQGHIDLLRHHHFLGDQKLADLFERRQIVHQVQHQIFEDHAQAAGPDLTFHRQLRDRFERVVAKLQSNIFKLEQLLVLPDDGVFRLGQDLHQGVPAQVLEHCHHRKAADKLRNKSAFDQIDRLHLFQHTDIAPSGTASPPGDLRRSLFGTGEPDRPRADTAGNGLFEPDESASADEQDVGGVHRREFLVRMLAPALRRNVGDGAFENLQQRLLHAFARNVAGNRRILVLAADFVDLVYIDDPLLAALNVPIGILKQPEDNIFNIFADIAGFGQRSGINDGERYVEDPG